MVYSELERDQEYWFTVCYAEHFTLQAILHLTLGAYGGPCLV